MGREPRESGFRILKGATDGHRSTRMRMLYLCFISVHLWLNFLILFFHEQSQRRRESVQKRLVADGPDLAVAEETRQRQRTKLLGDGLRIVIGLAEQILAPAIAAAEQPRHGIAPAER